MCLLLLKMEDIPDELILNWDHTPINIVPGLSCTIAQKGAKWIEMIALHDKCQIMAVVCGTLSREFLPLQIIYTGKTAVCLISTLVQWGEDQRVSVSNYYTIYTKEEEGAEAWVYFSSSSYFWCLQGQTTDAVFQLLEVNHIYFVSIPSNCMDKLQPMDLSINKTPKYLMKQQFSEWYSSIAYQNFGDEVPPPVDMCMWIMKPLGAQWLIKAYSQIKSSRSIITNGFRTSGITKTLLKTCAEATHVPV